VVAIYQLPVEKQEGKEQLEPAIARLKRLLACCEPISLAEMDGVSLLNRTDTKYVMGVSQLCRALQQVAGQYRVLEINCTRLNHYRTVYYDTPDFALYQQHHNGLRTRYKVREILGSGLLGSQAEDQQGPHGQMPAAGARSGYPL